MAEPGEVRWEQRDATGVITFDRPAARNALTPAMYAQLSDIVTNLAGIRDLRAVVLRGAGGTFVAGSDIAHFTTFQSAGDGVAYERAIDAAVGALESVRVPTLAVVEGVAAGAGLIIAAACDLRVCTPDARFGVPIARTVGNCLSMANTARLVANLGVGRTKKLLLLAEWLDADEARTAGFVHDVVDSDHIDVRVTELSERLAQHAPLTLAVSKEAIRRVLSHAPAGDDLLSAVYGSRDFREGVDAFLSRRTPRWTGE